MPPCLGLECIISEAGGAGVSHPHLAEEETKPRARHTYPKLHGLLPGRAVATTQVACLLALFLHQGDCLHDTGGRDQGQEGERLMAPS